MKEIGGDAFSRKTTLQSVSFPDSLTVIGQAFQYCTGLTNLTLPASLTVIKWRAFSQCRRLTQLTIPASLTVIGWAAFWECIGLTNLTLTVIEVSAFSGCTGLTELTLPDSLTVIGEAAFSGCTGLTNLTLPASLTVIGGRAFSECSALTQLTIPASVTSIGNSAFDACSQLVQVLFEGDASAFFGSSVFANTAARFKVQFYEGASGFTVGWWRGYPSESLTRSAFSVWRSRFRFGAGDLTAKNDIPLPPAYALKLDPTDAAARLPVPVVEGGKIRLHFPLAADRSDVLLKVECTADLLFGAWEPAGVETSGMGSVSIPMAGSESPNKMYLRFTTQQTE